MPKYNVTHSARIAAGVCFRCGVQPASSGTRACGTCRYEIRVADSERRMRIALERQAARDAVSKVVERRVVLPPPVEDDKPTPKPILRGMYGVMKITEACP